MEDENNSKRSTGIMIAIGFALFVVSYLTGIVVQLFTKPEIPNDGWGHVETALSFNPFVCIIKTFTSRMGLTILGSLVFLSILIVIWKIISKKDPSLEDERNFSKSKNGTYGTSGWMTDVELRNVLEWLPITKTTGTILGVKDNKIVSLPQSSRLNKHTAIFGASGTGKSRCFVRPQILQCVARGESVIITDPKGEIYADTAEFMRKQGYDVKMFNLVDPQYSDSWNCLAEITANPDQVELMAQTFCDVIIKNTSEGKGDHFWDNSELSLLKALCLYVCMDETRTPEGKNIGAVYEMLTNNDEKKLTMMFDKLPVGHPAKQPWDIYKKAGDTVRGNVIIGLGTRLQVFQADIIRRITTYPEIDMEGPAKRKSAYFVIMSDQDSTLDFLSSLFFSFLFIRLVRYADVKGKDGKCDVYVNFILDEFPNIGQIPDFTKKLSTIRSRELRVAVIFQNIAQLQNRYPQGLWEEIIGNCDTQLFLGCTDQMTAKFISERTGEMTIDVKSTAIQKESVALVQNIPQYRETESVGKRYVLTPDEVLRLEHNKALVIIRGQKVLKVNKFDYSNHPGAHQFEHTYIRDYVPAWKAQISAGSASEEEKQATIERLKSVDLNLGKEDSPDDTGAPKTHKTHQPSTDIDSLINSAASPSQKPSKPKVALGVDGKPIPKYNKPTEKPKSSENKGKKLYNKATEVDDPLNF